MSHTKFRATIKIPVYKLKKSNFPYLNFNFHFDYFYPTLPLWAYPQYIKYLRLPSQALEGEEASCRGVGLSTGQGALVPVSHSPTTVSLEMHSVPTSFQLSVHRHHSWALPCQCQASSGLDFSQQHLLLPFLAICDYSCSLVSFWSYRKHLVAVSVRFPQPVFLNQDSSSELNTNKWLPWLFSHLSKTVSWLVPF